ncbi:hypothetical protein [Candidatus Nitrosotenuis uzonensis]|uniref:Uncharacterized protein n=1 Tax=Candidatus Nitrosotenuis uzonensis TaxID=1407055 RepID=A0A812F3T0_9ARCH|nr:hypothetical protein [Candidatus Nitrosotenuis uzonensis]CAE6492372.1 conserved membrane hypothetical protein [Candidatus Nitrosotenuis uzonensis]
MRRQLTLDRKMDYAKFSLIGNLIVSIGIMMVTAGGSWDITNHILNKPETFFSPPHAVLYSGVGTALLGFFVSYLGWKKSGKHYPFAMGIKICGMGMSLLLAAGPADFVWHSNFGLDGLLSPPHLVLISGMMLSAVGAFVNSARYTKQQVNSSRILIIISLIPVWFSVTGLFYSFSLPFSETDYFDFNPHPVFAAAFASTAYPFLISSILITASTLCGRKFGVTSIIGISYLGIMSLTAIVPNESLLATIPFYWLNLIPIVCGDLVLSKAKSASGIFAAGAIFGSAFFFMYYPLITYTYNEVFLEKVIWPSLISFVYFEMVPTIAPILVASGSVAGMFGAKFAKKLTNAL